MNDFHNNHEHEHDEEMPLDEEDRIRIGETIVLKSVGIDIGSSTSHLMFSRLVLWRKGLSLSSQFQVVSREILYKSRVLLTPFIGGTTIATEPLSFFVSEAYNEAGLAPEDVDTGAVIITGNAARRDNAEAIAALFSKEGGKFVCATAGPNLEARMAAYGSGAVELSKGVDREGITVLNADVGGGTSKIAVVKNGSVIETASLNVGARLMVLDETRRIVCLEEAGRQVLDSMGLNLKVGDQMSPETEREVARALANSLFEVLNRDSLSPLTQELLTTPSLSFSDKIDLITFSGGVSEYIYGREDKNYGDMGYILAQEIRQRAFHPDFGIPLGESDERIRATVIGASQYTIQVSGSTIFISRDGVLPLWNLQVIAPRIPEKELTPESVKSAIEVAFRSFDMEAGERPVALAIHWPLGPAYESLKTLSLGIVAALKSAIQKKMPLVLVFDADIGKLVGNIVAQELSVGCDVVSIDGIDLQDFDYIDIGKEFPNVSAVPVIIKSLVFATKRAC